VTDGSDPAVLADAATGLEPAGPGLAHLVVTGRWRPRAPGDLLLVLDDGRSAARLRPLPARHEGLREGWEARFAVPASLGAAARTAFGLESGAGGRWDLPRPQRGV
jgi:hypothetical protein